MPCQTALSRAAHERSRRTGESSLVLQRTVSQQNFQCASIRAAMLYSPKILLGGWSMFRRIALLNILLLALAAVGSAQSASQKESAPKGKQPAGKTKAWKVQDAMSAAPRAIAKNATIVDQSGKEGGEMPVLRKGMNDWTCMPDDPSTPANDPMCLDKNAVDWAKAWKSHTEPKLSGARMGYMLQGGGSPSNTDPFATKPAEGIHSFLATQEIQPFPQTKIARKVRLSKQRVWAINKKLSETFPDPA